MSQHPLTISNESGALFRADVNNALAALVTKSSGNTAPTTTYPYQWWTDTSGASPVLKFRNAGNTAWIYFGQADLVSMGLNSIVYGNSAPSSPQPYQMWVDTSDVGGARYLNIRNGANTAWVILGRADLTSLGMMPLTGGTFSGAVVFSTTDAVTIPGGTTAQRPASPSARMIRFNSDLVAFEGYNGSAWQPIGGGGYQITSIQSISAGGTVNSSTTDQRQLRHIQGNSAPVSLSTTPFGSTGGWKDGTEILLMGNDDTNSVTLTFNDAAKGAVGNFTTIEITKYKGALGVYLATLDRWFFKEF